MSDSPTLPASTRIGRTALIVGDPDQTVAFYRDVVGLEVLSRHSTAMTLGVDGTPLLELCHESAAQPRSRHGTGLYHNAFRLPSRGALGDALDRIRDRWRLDGASDHDVSEALYLTDPEDNGVEIYRDRPREEWQRKTTGDLRIGSHSLDLEALSADADGDATTTVPAGTTVGHVHLEVSSIDAARTFYVDQLGFEVMMDATPSALFIGAGGYHHHLGVNTWHHRSKPADAGDRGLAWFELLVPSIDALETIRERLEDGDVSVHDIDDDGGSSRNIDDADGSSRDPDDGLEVTDPDGVRIRLVVEA